MDLSNDLLTAAALASAADTFHPFAFGKDFWTNFEVSLIFFVIDFIVIVTAIPYFIARSDKKKWSPMRLEIINKLEELHDVCLTHFFEHLKDCFAVYEANYCRSEQLPIPEKNWRLEQLNQIDKNTREYIDLLSAAIEPGMAGPILVELKLPLHITQLVNSFDSHLENMLLRTGNAIPVTRYDMYFDNPDRHVLLDTAIAIEDLARSSRYNLNQLIEDVTISKKQRAEMLDIRNDLHHSEDLAHDVVTGFIDIMAFHPVGERDFKPIPNPKTAFLSNNPSSYRMTAMGCLASFDLLILLREDPTFDTLFHDRELSRFAFLNAPPGSLVS